MLKLFFTIKWIICIQGAKLSWANRLLGLEAEYTVVNHFKLQE